MYGSGMGTLNVWTLDRKDKWDKVFGKEGNQGDQWIKAEVDIPAMDGLMVNNIPKEHLIFFKISP